MIPYGGTEGEEEGPEADAAEGSSAVYFGFVEESAGVGGQVVDYVGGGEAVDLDRF